MTVKRITLQMSEQDFTTLVSAAEYAWTQLETDMEKVFDDDFDQERRRLSHLLEELWEARRTVIAKGANV